MDYNEALSTYLTMKSSKSKKCFGCTRKVGNIFRYSGGIYYALCGDTKQPCDMDIQIRRKQDHNIFDMINDEMRTIEKTKQNIMELKVQFLFRFINEELLVEEFQKLKKILKESIQRVSQYQNPVYNERSRELTDITDDLNNLLKSQHEDYKKYISTKDPSILNEILTDIVENISPLLNMIRDLQYSYIDVENPDVALDDNKYSKRLTKRKYDEVTHRNIIEPEVIQFKIK